MKIAIPTMDGVSISAHFGKSKAFLILEFEGGAIRSKELRENDQHRPRESSPEGRSQTFLTEPGPPHDHGGFTRLLGDCQVVLVRGMGGGAMQAMRSAGIQVCRVEDTCSPEEAVLAFATGKLLDQAGSSCGCRGHQH
jgi:predicted Fe-Mo cluster-binding NifX family protein